MYSQGWGSPKDNAEALKWYRLAAKQGHVESQLNLGVLYANGLGIPKNYTVAFVWWSIASKQGNINARTNKEKLSQMMNTYQLEKAQTLEKECIKNDFQGC